MIRDIEKAQARPVGERREAIAIPLMVEKETASDGSGANTN
ncbi:hypothetical protein [Nocardia cyriacigeorgica]|uniref:Uncharacterized protein n=1 Tax=Nocardia cyriacigeorgica TaxID=135487 RepID=A0A4V6IC75_9NOCA|nr:hypothetical protein [Nocardia cyriacigeorgica]VFA97803.1 Uncharacterised protein [Nocardia cyriacigeorgica]